MPGGCRSATWSTIRTSRGVILWLLVALALLMPGAAAAAGPAPDPAPQPASTADTNSPSPDPAPQAAAWPQAPTPPSQSSVGSPAPSVTVQPSGGSLAVTPTQPAAQTPARGEASVTRSPSLSPPRAAHAPSPRRPAHAHRSHASADAAVSQEPLRLLVARMRSWLRLPSGGVIEPTTSRRSGLLLLLSALALATLCLASSALVRLLARLGDHWW